MALFKKKETNNRKGQEIAKTHRLQMDKAMRLTIYLLCIAPFVAIALKTLVPRLFAGLFFAGIILLQKPAPQVSLPPEEVFRQYVLDPVPASVTNIKADQPREHLSYTYTLRFDIDRADVGLLVNTLFMKRAWNVKYKDGHLEWAWDTWQGRSMGGVSIIVYRSGRREPTWFEPQLWNQPEAYVYEKKTRDGTKYKILLYNERKGEAYFIAQNWMN